MQEEKRKPAIVVSHLSKKYRLGVYDHGTFQHDLQSWWARKRGREDPNAVIGQVREGEFLALDDVSFTVYEGEAFGIIGRNGAGKSTLLKLLCEITAPTSGTVDVYGRIASMLEVGTGFDREMTGRENTYLNGAILGMSRAEIDRKIDDIIEFSEIGQFIDTPVKRYSSGMYVKLAFSVAAHLDNEIMVMDEVLAVGDVVFRNKCLEKMISSASGGRTVLCVSHNMNYIRRLCDRCAVLDHGRLVFVGDTEKAIDYYLTNILVSEVSRDLSQMPRSERLVNPRIKLTRAEYLGKESIAFDPREPMRMRLHWQTLADYERLGLRLEVWTIDDHIQAAYVVDDLGNGRAGEEREAELELDISPFGPATYKFKQTFFLRGPGNVTVDTDRVIGLFFEVRPTPGDYWDSTHWSHVRLGGVRRIR